MANEHAPDQKRSQKNASIRFFIVCLGEARKMTNFLTVVVEVHDEMRRRKSEESSEKEKMIIKVTR